jgi:hypothetical protein
MPGDHLGLPLTRSEVLMEDVLRIVWTLIWVFALLFLWFWGPPALFTTLEPCTLSQS